MVSLGFLGSRSQGVFKITEQMTLPDSGLCKAIRVANNRGPPLPCPPDLTINMLPVVSSKLSFEFFTTCSGTTSFGKPPEPWCPAPQVCSPSLLQLSWDGPLPVPLPHPSSPPGRWAFVQGRAACHTSLSTARDNLRSW